jgi:hypothetical protein
MSASPGARSTTVAAKERGDSPAERGRRWRRRSISTTDPPSASPALPTFRDLKLGFDLSWQRFVTSPDRFVFAT